MVDTMANLIRVRAEGVPDKPAIVAGDTSLTYADLDRESSQVAQGLLASGVQAHDRVGFFGRNSSEYFTLLFGAAKINAVLVAVNWRLAPPEVAYVLNDAGVKVLLIDEEFADYLPKMDLETAPDVIIIGSHAELPTYRNWVDGQAADDPGAPAAADDTCMQLYTSGTTGFPKGVELTNANFFGMMSTVMDPWSFDEDSVNLVVMPVFHIAGSGWGVVGLFAGGTNIVLSEFDPAQVLEVIPKYGVTNALFVPAILQFLLIMPTLGETDFSTLRKVVYGASPISEEILVGSMQALDTDFVQVYGLTETTGVVVQLDAEDHDPGGPRANLLRSAGRAMDHIELRIVDLDGNDMPDGEVGEIWTRSPQNMKGYWGNAEATAEAFPGGRDENGLGWFRTGDAGYLEDGYLFIHDRVKDMIVTGGENVYPAEIENVLMSNEVVSDAAVIGVPDETWGEAVKAIVVLADEIEDKDLLEYCRERLASFKCPRSIDRVEALPRNPSGKILKTELREPYWEGHERKVN